MRGLFGVKGTTAKLLLNGFKEKRMKEKKLTDEEIIKSLEHCSHNRSCEYCYHNDEVGSGEIVCRGRLMQKSLDLIHRLQDENKRLIEELKEEKVWFSELLQSKNELQKQVDELTSEITEMKSYYSIKGKSIFDIIKEKEQQAVKDTAKEILSEMFEWLIIHQFGVDENLRPYVPAKEAYDKVCEFANRWGVPLVETEDGKKVVWPKFERREE